MKRFFVKIGRFFWSWGFLKFVLGCIAFVILFYVEEDWRGARAWAATKAKWEARGETFDYSKFIPPPVPDDQNLAAIPLFKLEPVKNYDGTTYVTQVALRRAMRDDLPSFDFPQMPNWMKGELPDMAKIKKTLASDYALAFEKSTPPADTLAKFNAIYPFFTDFIAATVTHPVFRINSDYAVSPHAIRSLGAIVDPIKLSKILTLHGVLALDNNRPDLALQDLKANYELVSGVKRDPTLVGGLVSVGVTAIGNGILFNGLARHEWSDAQLSEIEQILKPLNFLADYQFAFRAENAQSMDDLDFFEHANRLDISKLFGRAYAEMGWTSLLDIPWPGGWWDDNKSQLAEFHFQELGTVDPKSRLVFPAVSSDLEQEVVKAKEKWTSCAPWNIWYVIAAEPLTQATSQFAQAQVWVDEARIACALERFRLANLMGYFPYSLNFVTRPHFQVPSHYPETLDSLVPLFIDELPRDIMNGEAYHYRQNADGTFLLYSVGWNQVDDGGKVAYKTGYDQSLKQIDYENGDWVWPVIKYNR